MASVSAPAPDSNTTPDQKVIQPEDAAGAGPSSTTTSRPTAPSRILSADNAKATGKFLKAFGKTAVTMHPLWLMGEAVTGKKVGGQLQANSRELVVASQAMGELLATSATDIVIIVNDKLREKGTETTKTADVIKKAGDNAIVVVSTSIEKAQDQLKKNSPALKRSIQKNGKQVLVVVDKGLKHPLVITGIHKYAKAQGIPRPEAILTLASLALSKIIAEFPTDEELAAAEAAERVDELDAEELFRTSTQEAGAEAKNVQEAAAATPPGGFSAAGPSSGAQQAGQKKKDGCVMM